ncbi:DUF1800 domain-containing protein [Gemmatimonas sp.]|uniref:DUF1800 domain-containing protein n=1 Tax=Gemmatimonas sp. TaxID=1962908 RepID=UPI00286E22F4|nr:DUF1800 domain-containing protein [Gemmatimonas sp.]
MLAVCLVTLGCATAAPQPAAGSAASGSGALVSAAPSASREQTADQQVHHLLNRLAFGARPGDVETVRAMGVDAWIDRQLYPERIPDAATEQFVARFTTLGKTGEQLLADAPPPAAALAQLQRRGGTMTAADSATLREQGRQSYAFLGELASSRVARAVISERQLNEVMVDFWENHFNVFAGKDRTRYFLPEYDAKTIRPHALGTFRDLLGAVAKSPAMLYYLDNWQSVADSGRPTLRPAQRSLNARQAARRAAAVQQRIAQNPQLQQVVQRRRGLNENYARELMELHTLGVDGGYTQQDVIEVARALTGWTIARGAQGGGFAFRGEVHDASAKTILGQSFAANKGVEEGEAVLDLLASHPSTAKFIATKLARRFVSDTPPAALVERATATFRRTNGDLRAVVRTIVTSPEFFASASYRAKVKSPFELVASTMRAMNAQPDATPRTSQLVSRLGQPIFGHQAPNGYPETGDAWMNTGAILNRINFGLAAASGRVPGITLAAWPLTAELANASRDAQVDGVIKGLFGGAASSDTRQVLLTGTNPFLQQHGGANDSLVVADDDAGMMGGMASDEKTANARRQAASERRAARAPVAQQQQAAGREAVRPARGGTLTQSIGSLPPLTGFAQIVGLALGAPEFQRR